MSDTDTTAPAAELLSPVAYTDTHGKIKAALVVGTPESTDGAISDGQVSLLIVNPVTFHTYGRFAALNADGTYHNRDESADAEPADADADADED